MKNIAKPAPRPPYFRPYALPMLLAVNTFALLASSSLGGIPSGSSPRSRCFLAF